MRQGFASSDDVQAVLGIALSDGFLCQLAYLCRQQAICIEARFSEIAAQLEDCPL
ncbi:hypothetical protein T01_1762 [Trichinella spiralis]|uniref:Uncharacterized protein n=1 Tax=Trichinella spiralis TaxID=6334 RepID=A0A0V0YZ96_TRISP|nr:hypothetical protein T01_1762 [Trichinella spiralis]